MQRRTVLNAGCGHLRRLPPHYVSFEAIHLDVDAAVRPDIVADVRDLSSLADEAFDAVFLSHLLEHFDAWEIPRVLSELARVLKVGGFVEIRVPHGQAVFDRLSQGWGIDQSLYESSMGPITAHDILYGHGRSIREGNDFMRHRTIFTPALLRDLLSAAGLHVELLQPTGGMQYELCAIARRASARLPVEEFEEMAEAMLQG